VFTLIGCDTDDNGGSSGGGNGTNTGDNGGGGFLALARMDIEDAHDIAIASNPETGYDSLYKITDDGDVVEVTYYDEEDKKMSFTQEPSAIYNVNSDYVIICFGGNGAGYSPTDGYLTRKTDGAVFSLNNVGLPDPYFQLGNFKNTKVIQSDSTGNIYYIAETRNGNSLGTALIKIDISNPNNLVKTNYVQITDGNVTSGEGFDITSGGHAIYTYGQNQNIRIRKSNGGLYNMPNNIIWWIGLDNKIKYYKEIEFYGKITTLNIDAAFNIDTSSVDVEIRFSGVYNLFYYILTNMMSTL
jgi:hypothetical protein